MRLQLTNGEVLELDSPCTQQQFATLVGITQPAVSALCTRGVLLPGQTAQEWLHRYLTNLREQVIARLSGRPLHSL